MVLSPDLSTGMEWSAVALNIVFTILIGQERRAGWLFGFVAAVISIALYAVQDAWLMAALNGFYAGMGVYGWWSWGRAVKEQGIITMALRMHALLIPICIAGTLILVWTMQASGLNGRYLWMEGFITASAMMATWLMSRKAVENWLYWMVGDTVAVVYNHWIGYNAIALLNIVYIILAVVGFLRWRRQMNATVALST